MPEPLTHRSSAKMPRATPRRMNLLEIVCLGTTGAIAGLILAAWIVPAFSRILPAGWVGMKSDTALVALLSAASLAVTRSRRTKPMRAMSLTLAAAVTLLSVGVLLEYLLGVHLGIDGLLAASHGSMPPGRMSPQTATAFAMLGVLISFVGTEKTRFPKAADLGVLAFLMLVLTFSSGYLFGALRLFGLSMDNRVAPQTLICLAMLGLAVSARGAREGFFAILLGSGIGGKVARSFSPAVLLLPFLLEAGRIDIIRFGLANAQYATAISTSLAAIVFFAFVLFVAWRIDALENEIQELSVRDDLTRLYNRKGFLSRANEALELARVERTPFSVLFIDLDNLKWINDNLGHDTGSSVLSKLAALLTGTFRKTDVIGRIGGDEFVVASRSSAREIAIAAERLQTASQQDDVARDWAFPFSFSYGCVTSEDGAGESLEHLLGRADEAMYSTKRMKKQARS